jgi:hypothetical protein
VDQKDKKGKEELNSIKGRVSQNIYLKIAARTVYNISI